MNRLYSASIIASLALLPDVGLAHTIEHTDTYQFEETRPDICYGIALSDASNFGPYQAGALIGLLKHQQIVEENY